MFSHLIRISASTLAATTFAGALTVLTPRAQTPPPSTFLVFFRSVQIGTEQVAVEQSPNGWTITSSGRIGPPVDLVLRNFVVRYDADWKPLELTIDATLRGESKTQQTRIVGTTGTTTLTPLGAPAIERAEQIDPQAVLLPNPFVAPYEALAARFKDAMAGTVLTIAQPLQGQFAVQVGASSTEQIKTVERTITARRTRATFLVPNAPPMGAEIWGDEAGRLLRVSVPAQNIEFAREDIASVATRLITMSRPNDEDVRIPANGFSLAGTVSKPATSRGLLPAVVLIGGSGPRDRDETISGVAIFGQLAHALADAGYLVLRYDKRGVGQSGGRVEAATLADYAEDAKAAVKMISARKDVDRKRVAIVGHGEGGWIALMTASRNDRVTAAGLVATVGVTGRELNLYQVAHGLERSSRPEAEKQATLDLQKRIQQAVISGRGWESIEISEPLRRQADTPYFHSFLTFDPARLMRDVQQPLLILQGELDQQVPPTNADRLAELAKGRKKIVPVDVIKVPGVNHLLVPATTGEVEEYGQLADRRVSEAVLRALVDWLARALVVRS